ncbi:hypothetical protein [Bradyrhizobium diversitatis]|uniref:Transcriptional regulator n=1 Tax=Bradyrhizobium diversitatis TaxID=2755406 RepID=A0ABS0P2L6_9BRAD|nr:hypothetical protein [Bradyrhizobium diversitatis]MBH5387360.1 hypothetical protein [Bradyrhizobium diversitatis]
MTATTPLDSEIHQLEAELELDPRFVRLKQLRKLREGYLALPSVALPEPEHIDPYTLASEGIPAQRSGRRRSPERELALQEARMLLRGKTEPTRITEIDAHLEARGIRLGGSDPLNNLSALLSGSGDFVAHGRAGWTLDQPH